MNWKTCAIHGPDKPSVWGCPECLRELREENASLRTVLDNLRTGRDGKKYDFAQSRSGSLIHVAPLIK